MLVIEYTEVDSNIKVARETVEYVAKTLELDCDTRMTLVFGLRDFNPADKKSFLDLAKHVIATRA
jgi:hypothetical protein